VTPEFASRSFMSIFGMLVWRFDRGHCGGKFAVDSPLEGRVHCELVSEIRCRFR
jgi:hypothetical protein